MSDQGNVPIGTKPGGNVFLPDEVPVPDPEHQKRITKERWFELGAVILIIVVGTAYLILTRNLPEVQHDPPKKLSESTAILEDSDYKFLGQSEILGQQFLSFQKGLNIFEVSIDVIGPNPEIAIDTVIIWLTPIPGQWELSSDGLQQAVNEVAAAAASLLPSSTEAYQKAINTIQPITDAVRVHNKGIAATNDAWKVTYITYKEVNDNDMAKPALYLILQRLSAGENPELAPFNRTLYEALDKGVDAKAEFVRFEAQE